VTTLTIASWNVNGLRASVRAGDFQGWLANSAPDIAGLQEVKAQPGQVDEATWTDLGYDCSWHPAERAGYSGALLLWKTPPLAVRTGIGVDEFDREGRVIEADFPGFTLNTAYFPNAGRTEASRLDFKFDFYARFLEHGDGLRAAGKSGVFMGDPTSPTRTISPGPRRRWAPARRERLDHRPIDTATPIPSSTPAPATPTATGRRDWRARNVGWRIDYVSSADLLPPGTRLHQPSVMARPCPVGIELTHWVEAGQRRRDWFRSAGAKIRFVGA
jgi:exodeoxyribonuclease-3